MIDNFFTRCRLYDSAIIQLKERILFAGKNARQPAARRLEECHIVAHKVPGWELRNI